MTALLPPAGGDPLTVTFSWDTAAEPPLDTSTDDLVTVELVPVDLDGLAGVTGASQSFTIRNNEPATASAASGVRADDPAAGAAIRFTLADPEDDTTSVSGTFTTRDGTFTDAPMTFAESTIDLEAEANGTDHTLTWDYDADIADGNLPHEATITIALTGTGPTGTGAVLAETEPFGVGNDAPALEISSVFAGAQRGSIPIGFTLFDPLADPAALTAQFSTDGGATFTGAVTVVSPTASLLTADPLDPSAAFSHAFVWDSVAQLPDAEGQAVVFRLVADDGLLGGQGGEQLVSLTVTNVVGNADGLTVRQMVPAEGPAAGGTLVTVVGTGFDPARSGDFSATVGGAPGSNDREDAAFKAVATQEDGDSLSATSRVVVLGEGALVAYEIEEAPVIFAIDFGSGLTAVTSTTEPIVAFVTTDRDGAATALRTIQNAVVASIDADANGFVVCGRLGGGQTVFGSGTANDPFVTLDSPVLPSNAANGEFDTFVARYRGDGSLVFARKVAAGDSELADATAMADGGVAVIGRFFRGDIVIGEGEPNEATLLEAPGGVAGRAYVARFAADGALLWAFATNAAHLGTDAAIVSLPNLDVVVAGSFTKTVDFGDGVDVSPIGSRDVFVARYEAEGALRWVKHAGATTLGSESVIELTTASDAVVLLGRLNDDVIVGQGEPNETTLSLDPNNDVGGFFVASFEASDGALRWATKIDPGEAGFFFEAFTVSDFPDGSVVVSGTFGTSLELFDAGTTSTPAVVIEPAGASDRFLSNDGFLVRYDDLVVSACDSRFCQPQPIAGDRRTLETCAAISAAVIHGRMYRPGSATDRALLLPA